MWSSANLPYWTAQHWASLYGGPDVWGGVRQFAEGQGAFPIDNPNSGQPMNYSSRQPLLGFYDLMQQSTVDTEIEMAASEGISFFAFYHYIDAVTGREVTPLDAPIPLFFNSSVRSLMKYVLAPIIGADQPGTTLSLNTWETVTVPILVKYLTSDSYFRLNGRPLIADFDWTFASDQDKIAAFNSLRSAVQAAIGVDPLIISVLPPSGNYDDLWWGWKMIGADGYTCFVAPMNGSPQSYPQYVNSYVSWMVGTMTSPQGQVDPTLTYMPCGSVGQDPRPWLSGPISPTQPWTFATNQTLWRQQLQSIQTFLSNAPVRTDDVVFLYAWNEWGESAHAIEPSKVNGYAYADIVREVFGLVPRTAKPTIP